MYKQQSARQSNNDSPVETEYRSIINGQVISRLRGSEAGIRSMPGQVQPSIAVLRISLRLDRRWAGKLYRLYYRIGTASCTVPAGSFLCP